MKEWALWPGRAWSVLILSLPNEIHANDSEAHFTEVFVAGSKRTHEDFFASFSPWRFNKEKMSRRPITRSFVPCLSD
jgi:hypothetical protein